MRPAVDRQPKHEALHHGLHKGPVFVHLDRHAAGVVLPDDVEGDPLVTLRFSRNFTTHTEVVLSSDGVAQELAFEGQPFSCFVPWDAIVSMRSDDDDFAFFAQSIPEGLKDHIDVEFFTLLSEVSPMGRVEVVAGPLGPFVPRRETTLAVQYRQASPTAGTPVSASLTFKRGWNGHLSGTMTDDDGIPETTTMKGLWQGRRWTMTRQYRHSWFTDDNGDLGCAQGEPYVVHYTGFVDEREGALELRGIWRIRGSDGTEDAAGVWTAKTQTSTRRR